MCDLYIVLTQSSQKDAAILYLNTEGTSRKVVLKNVLIPEEQKRSTNAGNMIFKTKYSTGNTQLRI